MKYLIALITTLTLSGSVSAQMEVNGTELGVDGTFYAGTNGGTVGLGVKYGWKLGDYIIAGPSARYQRSWTTNVTAGTKAGFNVYGGGGFAHARFFNALFVGTEIEVLRSPFSNFGFLTTQSKWVPTVLIGGGFSMEIQETWRLNLGIMYDIVDHQNSPLRTQYFMRNSQNVLIPVIYRLAFFFPIG
jgi:hypothetical protein